MTKPRFEDREFRKSSFSPPHPQQPCCVEVAIKDGIVAVRNSLRPQEATTFFTEDEWSAFTAGVKAGEFDV